MTGDLHMGKQGYVQLKQKEAHLVHQPKQSKSRLDLEVSQEYKLGPGVQASHAAALIFQGQRNPIQSRQTHHCHISSSSLEKLCLVWISFQLVPPPFRTETCSSNSWSSPSQTNCTKATSRSCMPEPRAQMARGPTHATASRKMPHLSRWQGQFGAGSGGLDSETKV